MLNYNGYYSSLTYKYMGDNNKFGADNYKLTLAFANPHMQLQVQVHMCARK